MGGCFYLISKSIIDFKNYEFITNIKIIYESELTYPAVTLCPNFQSTDNLHILDYQFEGKTLDKNSFEKIFVSELPNINKSCLRFNGRRSNRPGFDGGIRLIYYTHNESIPWVSTFVHENTIEPLLFEELSKIPELNKISSLIIEKTIQTSLGPPFSDCISEDDKGSFRNTNLVKETFNLGFSYRRYKCHELCFKKYCKNCNTTEGFDFVNNCKDCLTECKSTAYTGSINSIKIYRNYESKEEIKAWKEEISQKFSLKNLTDDDLYNNMVILRVYFQEFKYTEISQIAKTSEVDVFNSIGGALGLLGLGFAFIDIVDIIMEVVALIKNKYFKSDRSEAYTE